MRGMLLGKPVGAVVLETSEATVLLSSPSVAVGGGAVLVGAKTILVGTSTVVAESLPIGAMV